MKTSWMKVLVTIATLIPWAGVSNALVTEYEEIIYYHNDALGSPIAATNASGDVLWREEYSPYGSRLLHESRESDCSSGTCIPSESAWDEKQWFTGKLEESRNGIQYFGARWYEPELGRFLSVDPVQFREDNIFSFNRYAYANNNPYKYTDPDGRVPVIVTAVVGAVSGAVAGGLGAAAMGGGDVSKVVGAGMGALVGGVVGAVSGPATAAVAGRSAGIFGVRVAAAAVNAGINVVANITGQVMGAKSQNKQFSTQFSPGSVGVAAISGLISGPISIANPAAATLAATMIEPSMEYSRREFSNVYLPNLSRLNHKVENTSTASRLKSKRELE
jgi:RHS repeat-associated protein